MLGGANFERTVRVWRVLASALIVLCQPSAAYGYRTGSDLEELASSPVPVRFASGEVRVELFWQVPDSVSLDKVENAIRLATETWGHPGCSTFNAILSGSSQIAAAAGDGINTIQWVDDWEARGLSSDAAGLTDVQYAGSVDGSWKIVEADIYLNSAMGWTTHGDVEGRRDVQAVLTHELGHLAGLLHSCELEAKDDTPACKKAERTSQAMSPGYASTQVNLAPDDVDGICFLYPDPLCGDSSCIEEPEHSPPAMVGDAGASSSESNGFDDHQQPFGSQCKASDDCRDGHCLTIDGAHAQCTRNCGGNTPACPSGWECRTLESERVCTPQWEAGGCTVALTGLRYGTPLSPVFALGLMLSLAGWRVANRRPVAP
jgi:hypothetical protein